MRFISMDQLNVFNELENSFFMSEMITLAHGGGGRMEREWIKQEIQSRFSNAALDDLGDGAVLPETDHENWVVSTDSFVVTPRFFPGGNVGKLAVVGSANDVFMAGGRAEYMTLAMVIEEGFAMEELRRILDEIAAAAKFCGVSIVTGDTKVVGRGAVDGIFLTTTALGKRNRSLSLGAKYLQAGDRVLVSGTMGEHGFAVEAARHGISGAGVCSDCAFLGNLTDRVAAACGSSVRFLRDATRGGVGAVVQEMIENVALGVELEVAALPVSPGVKTMSEMLGIDPLFSACEGRCVMAVAPDAAECALAAMRSAEPGTGAAIIGTVTEAHPQRVVLQSEWGASRLMILPDGSEMPRIC